MALVDEGAVEGIEVLENEAALGLIIFNERVMVVDVGRLQWRRWGPVRARETRVSSGPQQLLCRWVPECAQSLTWLNSHHKAHFKMKC